jgi:hypothetical protein
MLRSLEKELNELRKDCEEEESIIIYNNVGRDSRVRHTHTKSTEKAGEEEDL